MGASSEICRFGTHRCAGCDRRCGRPWTVRRLPTYPQRRNASGLWTRRTWNSPASCLLRSAGGTKASPLYIEETELLDFEGLLRNAVDAPRNAFTRLNVQPHPSSEILARFEDGRPYIVSERLNQGRTIFWNASYDASWEIFRSTLSSHPPRQACSPGRTKSSEGIRWAKKFQNLVQ